MREILFRGKRIDNGEWVEGYYVKSKLHWHKRGIHEDWIITSAFSNGGYFSVAGRYAVDKNTVSQFTGLYDKNNVRIFEGDIISIKYNGSGELYRFEVKFGKCGGTENVEHDVGYIGFYFEECSGSIPVEYMLRKDPLYWINEYECEIVGNIYD